MNPTERPDFASMTNDACLKKADADVELLEAVYSELRAIAGSYFKSQDMNHTLQPTALVHEAFLKLVGSKATSWEGRAHFIAVAAMAMRQILTDHARHSRSAKRGGGAGRVTLTGVSLGDDKSDYDAIDIDEALTRLAEVDPRQARVTELRFFAGLTVQEAAIVLGVSDRTVEIDWRHARAWLRRELQGGDMP